MEKITHIDTHVVVWLYAGNTELLSLKAMEAIENSDLFISPIVALELQYLFEIDRLKVRGKEIIADLNKSIGLSQCNDDFKTVVEQSLKLKWTRDPFDRLIVAQAALSHSKLLTKDKTILKHYKKAFWS